MRQLGRYYVRLVQGLLAHRNPRYTPREWPWYVVVALSVPLDFLLLGPLAVWTHRYGPVLPLWLRSAPAVVNALGTLAALVVYPMGPAFALHYWLVFRSGYVQHMDRPSTFASRYGWYLLGWMAVCHLLFALMSAGH